MTERRRPFRRGRRPYNKRQQNAEPYAEPNPYRDGDADGTPGEGGGSEGNEGAAPPREAREPRGIASDDGGSPDAQPRGGDDSASGGDNGSPREVQPGNERPPRQDFQRRDDDFGGGGGRGRRNRRRHGRGKRDGQQPAPQQPVVADSETLGWFDASRDGGFIRRASNSYLADHGDAWISPQLVRQYTLRRGDLLAATTGRDNRGRHIVVEITQLNGVPLAELGRRPDFGSLTATYPERRLTLETGRPAKGGPELTRRAIDLVAPVGYGQRALIVAPARAGKTMLLHAITEGIAINHPNAVLLILLVDERPEEVSEAISWGVGEVIASSFDQPAPRHVEVCEMVLEHSRRMVEMGKDVVIVLDSLTRMARAHNTAERGSGRTMSGGLDTSAMAKPKAFFGSARAVHPKDGGGSLTIIATALVETGSRMDDVIFEEFKGTGNCEIKLDRSLAEKRIFPAFDIAASGTRREEKLYKEGQLDAIYTLRRGLQQMPPQSAMEWLIKRIAATQNNDALLSGL
ncbi:MAG: transcription termination factor Rho [Gemmatimonadaceae bacterium]